MTGEVTEALNGLGLLRSRAGEFESKPGSGIAIQLDVEDAVGVTSQVAKLQEKVEEEI